MEPIIQLFHLRRVLQLEIEYRLIASRIRKCERGASFNAVWRVSLSKSKVLVALFRSGQVMNLPTTARKTNFQGYHLKMMETEKIRTVNPVRSSTLANSSEVIGHSEIQSARGYKPRRNQAREPATLLQGENEPIASISLWAIHEHEQVLRDHVASSTNLNSTIRSIAVD